MTSQNNKKFKETENPQILNRFSINKNRLFQFDPNLPDISFAQNNQRKKIYWPLAKSQKQLITNQLYYKDLFQKEPLQVNAIQQVSSKRRMKSSKSQKKSIQQKSNHQSKQKNYLNLPSIKRKNFSTSEKYQKRLELNQQQKFQYIFGKNQRIKNSYKLLGTIETSLNQSKSKKQLKKSREKRSKRRNNQILQKLQLSGKHLVGIQKSYQQNVAMFIQQKYSQKVNLLPSQLLFNNRRQDIVKNIYKNILKLT